MIDRGLLRSCRTETREEAPPEPQAPRKEPEREQVEAPPEVALPESEPSAEVQDVPPELD